MWARSWKHCQLPGGQMSELQTGLIKLPCRVVPMTDPDLPSFVLYCDLVDDRGLRFATVWERAMADDIAGALNRERQGCPCSR